MFDTKYCALIKNIENYYTSSNDYLYNARNKLKVIDFKGEALVIKSFKIPHLLNQVIYSFFRESKAKKSYDYAKKIQAWTPQAIAYVEHYQFKLLTNSYFIAEKFEFDFDIRKPLLDANFFDREVVFKQFVTFVYQLHNNNILHLDLSPGNILIKKVKQHYQFKIVDVNRMQFKPLNIKTRAKNFNKLWADTEDLTIMLTTYAQLAEYDIDDFVRQGLYYNQQNKNRKNLKKRLRGQSTND